MSIILKVKFDPRRGGFTSYDFTTPAFRVDSWTQPTFSVLESTDNINYYPLIEGTEWCADIDWQSNRLRLHILKDYDSIIYLALATSASRNIPVGFPVESQIAHFIPAAWNTGDLHTRPVPAAYDIEGELHANIPAAFYEKFPDKRNIPIAYGISGANTKLLNLSFNIGTRHSINIAAGAWLMGVARLTSGALILPDDSDPAASRVRGRTKEIALSGAEWEDLD